MLLSFLISMRMSHPFVLHRAVVASCALVIALCSGLAHAQSPDSYTISGTVWSDPSGAGDPSADLTAMGGVIIRLHTDPDGDGDPSNGTVVQTTATESGGSYVLVDVEPGFYVVEQVNPAGATSTYDAGGDPTDSLVALEVVDEDWGDIDFLNTSVVLRGISGQTLLDGPLQDGVFGSDDLPMAGVKVHLYADVNQDGQIDSGDVLVSSVVTRRNGRYGFGGLVAGRYVVQEIDPVGAASVNDSEGAPDDNQVAMHLISADVTTADFLDTGITLATVSGSVRNDLDGDGDPADLDPPLAGVTLLLFSVPTANSNPFEGDPIEFTATTLTGQYAFPNLPPGHYVVFEFAPQGASGTYDTSGSLTDSMAAATIVDGDLGGVDFLDTGALTGIASGITWVDGPEQDGQFSQDDIPAAGISVALYADLDGDGVLSADDVFMGFTGSLAGGGFAFPPIVYGPYLAIQATPPGAVAVNDTDGSPTDATIGFIQNGSFFQNLYFLNQGLSLATLSGQVRNDLDGNGNPADIDPPLPNGRIRLFTDPNGDGDAADGTLLGSAITNGEGRYQFAGLAPGAYVIESELAQGATATFDPVGSPTDGIIPVQILGSDLSDQDFLSTGALLASISGTVWHEGPSNDGVIGADDIPLPGVTIQLYADVNQDQSLDINDLLITTVVTTLAGDYSFAGLPAGHYLVFEADPPGATSVFDSQGHPTDNTIAVHLIGSDVVERNFLDTGVSFSSIIGQVLDDTDENGLADPHDRPLPGVTIRLYVDLFSDGELTDGDLFLASTVTDAAGTFTFPGLPGGSYLVEQIDRRGATSTGDSDGANDNLVAIQLTFQDDTSALFLDAYDPTGYFYDVITGEIITGGAVSLSGPGGVTLWQSGGNGQYEFETDGTPGTYLLTVTPPLGFIPAPMRSAESAPFDPTGQPDPAAIGSAENSAAPGTLVDPSAPANPFYLTFTLGADDPRIINNNLPLVRQNAPTFNYWSQSTPGTGGSPTADADGDLTPDLLEYAFGTDPASGVATASRQGIVYNSVANTFDAFYTVPEQGRTDVSITVKVLAELANSPAGWSTTSLTPVSLSNGDGTRTITFSNLESDLAINGNALGFVRFEVAWDEDADGAPETVIATPVTGFQRRLLPAENITWGASFPTPAVVNCRIDAVAGSSLTLATSLNGQALESLLPPPTKYYLEILTGDAAGHRLEIDSIASNAAQLITIPSSDHSTLASVDSSLVSAHAVIRPFQSLSSAFPPTQYHATNNPATASRVMTYRSATQNFQSYWLYNQPGGPIWVREGDSSLQDQSGTLLNPQAGAFVQRRSSPAMVFFIGPVRETPFVIRLAQRQNFIANPWPMATSPNIRSMTAASGFIGSNNPVLADQFSLWRADSLPGSNSFDSYFYVKFSTFQFWVKQGDATLTNVSDLKLFLPGTATFARSIDGMPTFVVPSPWQP